MGAIIRHSLTLMAGRVRVQDVSFGAGVYRELDGMTSVLGSIDQNVCVPLSCGRGAPPPLPLRSCILESARRFFVGAVLTGRSTFRHRAIGYDLGEDDASRVLQSLTHRRAGSGDVAFSRGGSGLADNDRGSADSRGTPSPYDPPVNGRNTSFNLVGELTRACVRCMPRQ